MLRREPSPAEQVDAVVEPSASEEPIEAKFALSKYTILRPLAPGGLGVLWLAVDRVLNRTVVIKKINIALQTSPGAVLRFEREGRALAMLNHENIVQIYEFGDDCGQPYISMEWVDGGNLAEKLCGNPVTPEQAVCWILILAVAIQHAHQSGVLHRDLKPANVLLTKEGLLKIADFGLAKLLDEIGPTLTDAHMGTPNYMPPEQLNSARKVGPPADVYGLGTILYELLTGVPPFKGMTKEEFFEKAKTEDPQPVRQLNPAIQPELEAICMKCLRRIPVYRYASA